MRKIGHDTYEIDIASLMDNMKDYMKSDSYLPDPELLIFWKMYNERRIWIDLAVDSSAVEYARLIQLWNMEDRGIPADKRKPIWIFLQNYGGDGDMMWMLIDVVKTSVTPVYTVNMGVSASAAAILFIAGKKRFMMPNATVVIHEGSAQIGGDAVKVLDASDSYRKELKKVKEFILTNTKIPPATLNKRRNNDWTIDAEYCLEHGVCDQVVTSIDEIL